MGIRALLATSCLLGGCTVYFGDDQADDDGPGNPPPPPPANLDGSWTLERALTSAEPVPPRTAPCDEPYTTGLQPSMLTIAGQLVGTDWGSTLSSVTFGGAHDLSFSAMEYWNTVGWNMQHPIHYEFDQTSSSQLQGVVTAQPPWPDGACAYTFIIASRRVN